ncbi:hypothetical protein FRB91_010710 [Serendipita sp. 411]|nr:hypothetical protein FRB91_010710 [Serendipita sp. 411]
MSVEYTSTRLDVDGLVPFQTVLGERIVPHDLRGSSSFTISQTASALPFLSLSISLFFLVFVSFSIIYSCLCLFCSQILPPLLPPNECFPCMFPFCFMWYVASTRL